MSNCRFDFFLSFTGADRTLADAVYAILTAPLDGTPRYTVFYQPVNIPLAADFLDEMHQALLDSEKVLVLLTPNFFAGSPYTLSEFKSAFKRGKLLVFRFENAVVPEYASFIVHRAFTTVPGTQGFAEEVLDAARLHPTPTHTLAKRFSKIVMPEWKGAREGRLIGRDAELQQLTQAYEDKNCRMVFIVAAGGFGKSSLVTRWLDDNRKEFLGADLACFYSFAAQGSGAITSPDPCLRYCLATLSGIREEDLPEGLGTNMMADQVAGILNRQCSLFVLDGLETMQAGPDDTQEEGTLVDRAFKNFIEAQLTMSANGLCVITTRRLPPSMKGSSITSGSVRVIELKELTPEGSRQAFIDGGLDPAHEDLPLWIEHSGGHPLLIALLAPAVCENEYDPHTFAAHRVFDSEGKTNYYETIRAFVGSHLPSLGAPARALLSAICLFDSDLSFSELRRMLLTRPIAGFTDALFHKRAFPRSAELDDTIVEQSIKVLRKAALISIAGPRDWRAAMLHVHPLIQAGHRADLKQQAPQPWKEANFLIYKTRIDSVKTPQPDQKKELLELYAAVPHGVEAGRGKAAGWMYAKRCLRYFRGYSTNNHGMIGDDVALISHYFTGGWKTLRQDLNLNTYAKVQAYVWAGVLLSGVNRSADGCPLMEEGLRLAEETRNFTTAARTARFLGTQHAMNGELEKGEYELLRSVEYLNSKRPLWLRLFERKMVDLNFQSMASHTLLASVLHYRRKNDDAEEAFAKAEARLSAASRFKSLRGIWCFRKSEFLIDNGRFDEADALIEAAMECPEEPKGWGEGVFAQPVLELALIRSRIRRADVAGHCHEWDKVQRLASRFAAFEADQRLRMDWLIPMFKMASSGVARLSGAQDTALYPLDEADKWVARSGNRLFASDIQIERHRVHKALGNHNEAAVHIARAMTMAGELGYRSREPEIAHLRSMD